MKNLKKLLSLSLVAMLTLGLGTTSVSAAESTTVVNGSVSATVLNVSVAASTAFTINPSAPDGSKFVAPTITVTNSTDAPIRVSVKSFTQDSADLNKFTDVYGYDYTDYEWKSMGITDSKGKIALGIKNVNTVQYKSAPRSSEVYAKEVQTAGPVSMGILGPGNSSDLTFVAKHGNAFTTPLTLKYNVVFLFDLAS